MKSMRIMIDTNIIVSAVLLPHSKTRIIMNDIMKNHIVIISSYVLAELNRVFQKKFIKFKIELNKFLLSNEFEFFHISLSKNLNDIPYIRDKKDYPILVSFIKSEADLLVTGDNDYFTPELEKYNIIKPNDYFNLYMNENVCDR